MYFSGFNQRNQQGFNPIEELFHQILQQQAFGDFGADDEEVYDIPNGRTMDDILQESFQMSQNETKGPPPAKKEFVNRLPVYNYTEERKEQMQKCTETLSCAICQSDFEMGDVMLQLPCHHSFHKDCIQPWITEHNTCPVCRYELPVDDFKEEQQRQQRMIERFTKNGLKLMEIGSEIETAFMKVSEISQQFQEAQKQGAVPEETRKQLLSKLNQADSVLMNKMIELDSMENLENSQVKDQRKQLLLKIQTVQSIIDKCKNTVRSS